VVVSATVGPARLRRWRWPALVALAAAAAVGGLGAWAGGVDRTDRAAPVRRWRCGNETPAESAALDRIAPSRRFDRAALDRARLDRARGAAARGAA
jgi:hypothetical protein